LTDDGDATSVEVDSDPGYARIRFSIADDAMEGRRDAEQSLGRAPRDGLTRSAGACAAADVGGLPS
jgi:hypothetical protein